jgi:hypothetical protein
MALPGTIRCAPSARAVSVNVVINAVGMPACSISLLITAPQRVPVPHVEVKIAAETPSFFRSRAIFSPSFFAVSTGMATPVVV